MRSINAIFLGFPRIFGSSIDGSIISSKHY